MNIKNIKFEYKFYTMDHRGSLYNSLLTLKHISRSTFYRLKSSTIYKFYGYDSRINCNRYILESMENDIGLPTWLIEVLD